MSLSAFLKENAAPVDSVFFVVSDRFKGEDGAPVPWEIRAVDGAKNDALQQACQRRVPVPGRKNQYRSEIDAAAYLGKLTAACTVFPNLNSKDLQDSYGVMGAESLLRTMLTAGEYTRYQEKVQEVCGFDVPIQDDIEEAKN